MLLANILAKPLIDLAGTFSTLLKPGADIILSGLLSEQTDDVLAAYKKTFSIKQINERDGWICIHAQKHPVK